MLKLAIAAIVFAHGIGHLLFLVPTVRLASWAGQTGHSWAITPVVGDLLARAIGGLIWTAATVLFVAAVGGLLAGTDWWRAAAVAGAVISIIGIVVMWDGILTTSAFFALVFNLLVLAALVWARWPSVEAVGS